MEASKQLAKTQGGKGGVGDQMLPTKTMGLYGRNHLKSLKSVSRKKAGKKGLELSIGTGGWETSFFS